MADPERCDADALASLLARVKAALPTEETVAQRDGTWKAQTDAEALRRMRARWKRAGIPERTWPALLAPSDSGALQAVKDWLASDSTILFLTGPPDRGKTVAACWALGQIEVSGGARFVKAVEVVRRGMFATEWWDDVYAARIVVLDDLGTEPLDEKGYALANVQALLDRAYDGSPRIIVTANLGLEVLKSKYLTSDGGRSLERVRERGQIVECVEGTGFRPSTMLTGRV